jgi:hypothetical protein
MSNFLQDLSASTVSRTIEANEVAFWTLPFIPHLIVCWILCKSAACLFCIIWDLPPALLTWIFFYKHMNSFTVKQSQPPTKHLSHYL